MVFNRNDIEVHRVYFPGITSEYTDPEYDYNSFSNEEKAKKLTNIHTHGMEKYGKKNVCLAVEYNEELSNRILMDCAEYICGKEDELDLSYIYDLQDEMEEKPYASGFFLNVKCIDEDCYIFIRTDTDDTGKTVIADGANTDPAKWREFGIEYANHRG